MRALLPIALSVAWALLTGFSSDTTFDLGAEDGGGGGYSYTGSPANHGMGCDQCHQGNIGGIDAELSSSPPGLFTVGFEPGQTYLITVRLVGERFGLDRQGGCAPLRGGCNRNAFVAEITDAAGAPRGVLCPVGIDFTGDGSCGDESGPDTTLIAKRHAIGGRSLKAPVDCAAVGAVPGECIDVAAMLAAGRSADEINAAFNAAVRGSTTWAMQWRAPGTASGSLHLWLGVVDGDGGTRVDPTYNDYEGDGVRMVHAVIPAAGIGLSTGLGCGAGGTSASAWIAVFGAVGLAWRGRRRAW